MATTTTTTTTIHGSLYSFADKHKDERCGLIANFRAHFCEYDLQEEQIFDRFNADVQDTVKEKNKLYGELLLPYR
jgi:hypothetical protein